MPAFTLAYRKVPTSAEIDAVLAATAPCRASVAWSLHAEFSRAYALVEGADDACVRAISERVGTAWTPDPIIALAIAPSAPEALPGIVDALSGPGAPDGIRACDVVAGNAVVEWNLERTGAAVVLGLVDVELARFCAHRTNVLLSPIPLAWWSRIAASGLAAPEIAPDRVLEALIGDDRAAR